MNNRNNSNYINTSFLLDSIEAWEEDKEKRFNLDKLNSSFRDSVPILEFIDWKISSIKRGYTETILPLNPNSSNQYITHQAALMLLSADYTGGLAIASLFHLSPIVGFWETIDEYGIYMWGAAAKVKWHAPSCNTLTCRASIPKKDWVMLAKRMKKSKKIAFTVKIEMFNGSKLVAESDFTYWAQDINNLRHNALDENKIALLYEHKLKTTAKLIAGMRALEQRKPPQERWFEDPYALMLAGTHGTTLAKRFYNIIPQLQNMVSARTIHLDKSAIDFAKGKNIFNIVNIGAGYDSRFWRLELKGANIYELDLPIMLNDRKRIFDYSMRKNIHSVSVDLRIQSIDEVLLNNESFNKDLPTFFIWEGCSMYFTKDETDSIISSVSKVMSKGSCLWIDYVSLEIINGTTNVQEIEYFMKNMSKLGENFINGFDNFKHIAKNNNLSIATDVLSNSIVKSNEEHYKHYKFCILKK